MTATEGAIGMDVFDRRESAVRGYCRQFNVVFDTAQGSVVRDTDGREYLDFLAGCSSLNYGHNDEHMRAELMGHLKSFTMSHGLDLHTGVKAGFLEAFERLILAPRGMNHVVQFTGPTGTNAVEAALKLARSVTGRTNVIAFTNGYHGMTLGALAATGNATTRMAPHQPLHGVTRAFYDGYLGAEINTADLLRQVLDDPSSGVDQPAAVLVELVQGEGGLNTARPEWLAEIADITRQAGALLIVDDIQAGCGRTGSFFSFDGTGVVPDLVTLSKSLSGFGLPLAVLLLDPAIDTWLPGQHNGTFRGNSMAFATARVALEKFWSDTSLMDKVAIDAETVTQTLRSMRALVPGSVLKGRGMFQGLDVLDGDVAGAICARAFELGLIAETAGSRGQVLKVLAPLTTPADQLDDGLARLRQATQDVVDAVGDSYMEAKLSTSTADVGAVR